MHNLSDLRDMFLNKGTKIKKFVGWYLKVGKDTYTMLDGEIYKNKEKLTKKEVLAIFKKKK